MNHVQENQTENNKKENNKNKKKVKTAVLIIIIIILFLLLLRACGEGRTLAGHNSTPTDIPVATSTVTPVAPINTPNETPTVTPTCPGPSFVIDDGGEWDGDNSTIFKEETEEEMIEFPGFTKVVVNEANQEIQLYNFPENTVYFVYTITDATTGDVVFTTDAIAPGNATKWNVYETLGEGTHTVVIETMAWELVQDSSEVGWNFCQGLRNTVQVIVQ